MPSTTQNAAHSPLRWLVTLGPTHEPIDAVRFVGNRSSGRMGFEIANAARQTGAHVRIFAGPCSLADNQLYMDSWSTSLRFQNADDLRELLSLHWKDFDVLVMAAAVADWRVVGSPLAGKLRRTDTPPALLLEPVAEILGNLKCRRDQFVLGFALEPKDELLESARKKLTLKKSDCIVANSLETMHSDHSDAQLVWPDGTVMTQPGTAGRAAKEQVAQWIVSKIIPAVTQKCIAR